MDQSIFLAVPHNGSVAGEALPGLLWPTDRGGLMLSPGHLSLLTTNFNQLWAEALNHRAERNLTHFAMHHDDIEAPQFWVDTLVDEMERVSADVLSVVVPLKDSRGLTTTAVGSGDNSIRRLTLTEVHRLPETFRIDDVPGSEPGRRLLVNTGLWVCRMTDAWVEEFSGFKLQDNVRRNEKTGRWEALCLSEDWGFSEWCHGKGLRVFATRKVPVVHYGTTGYSSAKPWGTWTTDHGDADKNFVEQQPQGENVTEAQFYEKIGRLQSALEQEQANFATALQAMAEIISGKIEASRVMVDLTNKSFVYVGPGEKPPSQMTINGLPKIVMGRDDLRIMAESEKTEAA